MKGLTGLFESKKGTVFSGTAGGLVAMMATGSLPPLEGAQLLVVLAAAHILGQGIADLRKRP